MDILLTFTSVTIFTLMLTIGVNQSLEQLTSLWHQRAVLLRALFAVLVLIPAVVIALLSVFALSPEVATGLALLAAAPGAPLTTKRSQMAAADIDYVTSLQLTLALLAIVVTPLIVSAFYAVFELTTERVSPLEVAWQIARVTFLPVIVGLTLQRFAPKLVAVIGKPLNVLANVLFFTASNRADRCSRHCPRAAGEAAVGLAGNRGDPDHCGGRRDYRPPARGATPGPARRARGCQPRAQYWARSVYCRLE